MRTFLSCLFATLVQVVERVRSAWEGPIADALRAGRRVAATAHGNSLRALIQLIEGTSDDEIAQLEVPNAVPIVVELDAARRVLSRRFLGSATAPASEIL